jgi:hypothetical protein
MRFLNTAFAGGAVITAIAWDPTTSVRDFIAIGVVTTGNGLYTDKWYLLNIRASSQRYSISNTIGVMTISKMQFLTGTSQIYAITSGSGSSKLLRIDTAALQVKMYTPNSSPTMYDFLLDYINEFRFVGFSVKLYFLSSESGSNLYGYYDR